MVFKGFLYWILVFLTENGWIGRTKASLQNCFKNLKGKRSRVAAFKVISPPKKFSPRKKYFDALDENT